ncbi:MAG: hypothetical protein ACREP8_04655 [Candidatus Binatia bacterium]
MKRWLLIGGGLIVLVVIAVSLFLYSSLDSLIKAAVEKYGSEVTQTEVRLDKAAVSVASGAGDLRGLSVGNPSGFRSPTIFRLGEISLALNVGTVTSDTVVIKEIVVLAPEVMYEIGLQGSNIDALKRNINAYTATGKTEVKTTSKPEDGEGRKFIIENLYIRNGTVHMSSAFHDKTLSAPLPTLHLTNIGKQKGGAVPAEVAQRIVDALALATTKAVASADVGGVLVKAKEGMGGVTSAGAGGVDTVKGLFGK